MATSARCFRPKPFALTANRRRWSSLNRTRRSPSCSRNPVLLAQVLDRLQLALIHPARAIITNWIGSRTLGIWFARYRNGRHPAISYADLPRMSFRTKRDRSLRDGCATEPPRRSLCRKQIRSRFGIHVEQEFFCVPQSCKNSFSVPWNFPRKVLGNIRLAIFEVVHHVNGRSKKLVRFVFSSVHLSNILFPST